MLRAFCTKVAAIVGFVTLTVGLEYASAEEGITVTLSYKEIHNRVLPFEERTVTNVEVEAHLSSNGEVKHSEHRSSGRHQLDTTAALKLGPGESPKRWRVINSHQLLNVQDYDSYSRGILLIINNGSCSAQVNYRLKPGFTDYRYHRLVNGEPAVATSVEATDLSCTVNPGQDEVRIDQAPLSLKRGGRCMRHIC